MVLTKVWIQSKIDNCKEQIKHSSGDHEFLDGLLSAFEIALEQLSVAPQKSANSKEKPKVIDSDKIYAKIVKYYVDVKGYDIDHANKIAQSIINGQR